MTLFLKPLLLNLAVFCQRQLLDISREVWDAAVLNVTALDAQQGMTNDAKLEAAEAALARVISAHVGTTIQPCEMTRRLAQAAHWYLRMAQYFKLSTPQL